MVGNGLAFYWGNPTWQPSSAYKKGISVHAPSFFLQRLVQWLLVATLLGAGCAMAQSEPNMAQIYATAQAGKLDDAQVMIQQVLLAHPQSAKAHYVQAELYARQGKLDAARAALASADKLAPGLAFAKPQAVQALRAQLSAHATAPAAAGAGAGAGVAPHAAAPQAPATSSWLMPVLLTGGVMVAAYFFFRRRQPEPTAQQSAYANPNGLNGPQTFGMGGGMQPAYPAPGYPQAGYPQQAGSGLGGRIMGGVATGLAVGAGVMAAQAIGRNLMGEHNSPSPGAQDHFGNNDFQPLPTNTDMGGANFGINDAGSWDDGGGADMGGGSSDWDN